MWAQLILDNKAAIEDVPAQLQAGVGEVVDYFTKNAQPAESKPTTEPTTAPASVATTVATTGQSDADQAIDDANKAVDDATK
ncbi:hypothetical protein FD14_GL001466 [Secundilactobacillus similis DSM 23365 = JCM 2765]|uniref:Uncharacterized protein n=2 Tax=Secundilactobacillus similis TaxID=414682 RepID=A0A0R2EW65_9LACO|nr:hypothetical protein FD14_GL001466 [Secundilactobacillus similis DSM 23365 = JCM 2765]